jgi:hypothetical protein
VNTVNLIASKCCLEAWGRLDWNIQLEYDGEFVE